MSAGGGASPRRRTLEQARAVQAARDVRGGEALPPRYRELARGLPAMILINGLGQTCAGLRVQGPAGTRLYAHMARWLCSAIPGVQGDLLDTLMQSDIGRYRRAQTEALAYAEWLKRLSDGTDTPDPGSPS